jgi:sugar lactone lactonase YvrE
MRKRYLYFCAVLTIVVLGIQGCGSNSNPTSTTNNGPSPYSSGALTVVSSGIDQPYGITFDSFSGSGDIWFVANSNPGTIYGYTTAGAAVTSAYYYTGTSSYDYPIQVCTDPNGYIYVADQINNQVEVLTSTGAYDNVISGLNRPSAVAVNSAGTTLYVVNDTSPVAFLTYSITGASYPKTYTSKANSFPTGGATYDPSGVTSMVLDASGNVYANDFYNSEILKYGPTGASPVTFVPAGISPWGLAFDSSGNLFVTEHTNPMFIQEYSSTGSAEVSIGAPGSQDLTGITVDGSGNLFVSDSTRGLILEFKK